MYKLLVAILSSCIVTCTAQQIAPIRQRIPAKEPMPALQNEKLIAAIRAGDVDGFMSLFTPNFLIIDEECSPHKREGFRSWMAGISNVFDRNIYLNASSLSQNGDLAVARGTFIENRRVRSTGKTESIHGSYVFDARRQTSGIWLFSRVDFCRDLTRKER